MTVKALGKRRISNPHSFRKASPGDKALDVIIWVLVIFAVVVTLYPFLYVVSVSISEGSAVARGDVLLFPKGFSLDTLSSTRSSAPWPTWSSPASAPIRCPDPIFPSAVR